MAFDGADYGVAVTLDTGLFPIWSKHGCRRWLETRFGRARPGKGGALLRTPFISDPTTQPCDCCRMRGD
jgi:hypothetical protein